MNNFTIKDGNYYVLGNGMGDDGNPGTIDAPRATFGTAAEINGKKCVLRGTVEQNIASIEDGISFSITGDSGAKINGLLKITGYYNNGNFVLENLTIESVESDSVNMKNVHTALKTVLNADNRSFRNTLCINNILVLHRCIFLGSETTRWKNLTVRGFVNGCTRSDAIIYDSIVYGDFDLYIGNTFPVFKYSLFLKNQTVFKWNGTVIPITWTAPGYERQDIIDSLTGYADAYVTDDTHKNYLKACAENLIGEGTIIYDDSPGNVRIFNGYDEAGVPSDLNLNMQNGNPALFISSDGDYIGAMRPAFKVEWDWANMKSITEDGTLIWEAAELLQENGGIFVNIYSTQKRNRVKATQVLAFPGGDRLSRIAAGFESAADRGIYFGPWQNEVAGLVPLDAMEAEVYDTPAQPSAYPRLLIPFNRNLEIAYFKTGEKAGQPVLFSDLEALEVTTNKNLTEVADWAVTNGAQEFYDVSALEQIEIRKPKFRYILPVLTANKQD